MKRRRRESKIWAVEKKEWGAATATFQVCWFWCEKCWKTLWTLLRSCLSMLKVWNSEIWGQIKSLEEFITVGSIFFGVVHCQRAMQEFEQCQVLGTKWLKIGRPKYYKCVEITKKPRSQLVAENLILHVGGRSFGCLTESLLVMISKFLNLNCAICFWIVDFF